MTRSRHAVSGLQQASHFSRRYAKIRGFPPYIEAEPARAKRESRITCMRMLRTNQSKITMLLAPMCRAIQSLLTARALKKHFLWRRYCGKKKKNKLKCGLSWSTLLSTTSTRLYSFPKHSGLAKICFVIFDIIFDIVSLSLIYCQDLLTIAHFGKEC